MEGGEIYTVEPYRKVRLACAAGMSKRAAARHFNISRDSVDKILAFSAYSGAIRPPIPKLSGHPLRFYPATDSGASGHPVM